MRKRIFKVQLKLLYSKLHFAPEFCSSRHFFLSLSSWFVSNEKRNETFHPSRFTRSDHTLPFTTRIERKEEAGRRTEIFNVSFFSPILFIFTHPRRVYFVYSKEQCFCNGAQSGIVLWNNEIGGDFSFPRCTFNFDSIVVLDAITI